MVICMNILKKNKNMREQDDLIVGEMIGRHQGLPDPCTSHSDARQTLSKSLHFLLCLSSLPEKQRQLLILSEGLQYSITVLFRKCLEVSGKSASREV